MMPTNFDDGGGGLTVSEWLKFMDENERKGSWRDLQKSFAKGTVINREWSAKGTLTRICFDFGYYGIRDYINEWIWQEAFPSIQRPCVCWNGAPPRDREKVFFLPRHDKTGEYRSRHGWDYMSLHEIIEGLVEFHNLNRLGSVPTSLLRKALKETQRANKLRLKLVQE
jgi:hypothetical protein